MDGRTEQRATVRDLVTAPSVSLTPSEEKVVRVLLSDYPISGLGTATSLAQRASVSDPTVLRFIMKLGFGSFADFQARLLAEIEERVHSPLQMLGARTGRRSAESPAEAYLQSLEPLMAAARQATAPQTYRKAAALIYGAKGTVFALGGRFSGGLASMLGAYLVQQRPRVRDLGPLTANTFDAIADMGRNDVLLAFDYRRYQHDVIAFARQAAARDVRVVLFTDRWLSPIAEVADTVLTVATEAASPYDTFVPAVAQIEALVVELLAISGDEGRRRIEAFEDVRKGNAVTMDTAERAAPERSEATRRSAT